MSNQAYNELYGARADAGTAASNEPSQAHMLDQMRGRLASLNEEARTIRSQVPHEFEPDLERIQAQMQRLGERLSDLGRGAIVPYNAVQQRASETRVKTIRYVTEEDVRVARVSGDEIILLGTPGNAKRADEALNPWDDAAAKALVELYESEVYGSHRREPRADAAARQRMPATAARPQQPAPTATPQQALYVCAPTGVMSDTTQSAPRGCSMDTNYLDQRFAEIAVRIEQSLARMRPEAALHSLGSRFDALETQLNSVLGHVATRADLDELRAAEAQIEEISNQLGYLRRQLARLDVIDAHLGTLTSQLSDERLSRLAAADNGRLDAIDAQLRMIAVQLSDERLSGLVSRSSARDDYEELANSVAQRAAATFADAGFTGAQSRDIGEVRGMLENLINERRHNDENNASMLETMQQAIIRVLDRIDALEITEQPGMPEPATVSAPARYEMPAMGGQYHPAPAMTAAAPAMHDDLVPPTARVYAEMPPVEDHSDFLPMEQEGAAEDADYGAFRHDSELEHAPPRIPAYTTASFDLDAAFSRSRDAEAEAFGAPQQQKRSMETLRHDFIADAHRAKLKAAAKPDVPGFDPDLRAGELSVNPTDMPGKGRARRSIFSFRSQRVAMGLLVLLAAIPAAIFFMPRTSTAPTDVTPAAIEAPMPTMLDTAPALAPPANVPAPDMQGAPEVAPPAMSPPPKQTKQVVPPLEKGEYEDVNATGADIDTASLPGIEMQANDASGQQILQVNEQQRMAYLSGQLGAAAARATPAALLQEKAPRNGGSANVAADEVAPATDGSKLPPATVGPFSLRLAAGKGDASAQFEVASRLAEGKGLDQDIKEAAEWYHRSAASGFAMAQFRLGTLYERGLGVKRDAARAQSWYERAAAQGNVKAMHNLAVLAASRSPKGDYDSAARWFTAAAEHGLADSQYNLAVLYENGMGVTKDMQKAYKWLLLAAKQGDKDAAERVKVLKPKMSAGDLAAAKDGAANWGPKPMKSMANDARFAGQAWRESSRRG